MLNRIFSIFWQAPGGRPVAVVACMLLASLAEMTSMGAMIPLISQLNAGGKQSNSWLGRTIVSTVESVGISPTFTSFLLIVGTFLALRALISFTAMRFVAISVAEVATVIRGRLVNSMINARWSYFVDSKPGELATMITAQSAAAGEAYSSIAMLITTGISTFGFLITALLVSARLVAFCFIATVALALPLYYILQRARKSSELQWKSSTSLTTGIQDVLNNMKPLKSMGRQERYVEAFTSGIKSLREAQISMAVSRRAIYHGQDLLGMLMLLSGVYVAVEVLGAPISEMVVVGIIFYQLIDFVKQMQLHFQDATVAAVAYQGVVAAIDRGESQKEPDSGTVSPRLDQSLVFQGVDFSYGAKKVLEHVDIEIPANRITVLIGASGAGKTTVIDLIIGFYQPAGGRILVDGIDLKDIHLSEWRKMIGYVPQELTLLRGTVADNITLGDSRFTNEDVHEALALAGARGFIDELPDGIKSDIGNMGAKLSGGQRQRISLARALIHKPKLLLLDEVTSALDDASEAEICQNIKALSGALTIVAITHKPAWTLIADRVYRIHRGKATSSKKQPQAAAPASPKPAKRGATRR